MNFKTSQTFLVGLICLSVSRASADFHDTAAREASAQSDFGLDLFSQVQEKSGNICVCPLSVRTVLALAYQGARGATADEMAKVLRIRNRSSRFCLEYEAFLARLLETSATGAGLLITNSLWAQAGVGLSSNFQAASRSFAAYLGLVDFERNPNGARQQINSWMASQTKDSFPELVPSGLLATGTRLLVANAVHFKGEWETPFARANTKNLPFWPEGKSSKLVPMMQLRARFPYAETGGMKVLDLPYVSNEFSMLLLLPQKSGNGAGARMKFTSRRLHELIRTLRAQEVSVIVPRFKCASGLRLAGTMANMGMRRAFSSTAADFSGISAQKPLYIGEVLHRVVVEVDEEGTRAAASAAAALEQGTAPEFVADRPFLFLIWHKRTGAMLFVGRVSDPSP